MNAAIPDGPAPLWLVRLTVASKYIHPDDVGKMWIKFTPDSIRVMTVKRDNWGEFSTIHRLPPLDRWTVETDFLGITRVKVGGVLVMNMLMDLFMFRDLHPGFTKVQQFHYELQVYKHAKRQRSIENSDPVPEDGAA